MLIKQPCGTDPEKAGHPIVSFLSSGDGREDMYMSLYGRMYCDG